jgi:hypothetical protein
MTGIRAMGAVEQGGQDTLLHHLTHVHATSHDNSTSCGSADKSHAFFNANTNTAPLATNAVPHV